MELHKLNDMVKGWFIGNFEPTVFKTNQFEVAYHTHVKGSHEPTHYHKKSREYNVLIKGEMIVNDKELKAGDIFILEPYEVSEPTYLTDVEIIIVRVPSVTDDKYVIKE